MLEFGKELPGCPKLELKLKAKYSDLQSKNYEIPNLLNNYNDIPHKDNLF